MPTMMSPRPTGRSDGRTASAKRRPLDSRCSCSQGDLSRQCSSRSIRASACRVGSPPVSPRLRADGGSRLMIAWPARTARRRRGPSAAGSTSGNSCRIARSAAGCCASPCLPQDVHPRPSGEIADDVACVRWASRSVRAGPGTAASGPGQVKRYRSAATAHGRQAGQGTVQRSSPARHDPPDRGCICARSGPAASPARQFDHRCAHRQKSSRANSSSRALRRMAVNTPILRWQNADSGLVADKVAHGRVMEHRVRSAVGLERASLAHRSAERQGLDPGAAGVSRSA